MARDCDTEPYAASAKEKAIAYLSTEIRPRCISKSHHDGTARARRKTLGILAECLPLSAALVDRYGGYLGIRRLRVRKAAIHLLSMTESWGSGGEPLQYSPRTHDDTYPPDKY